MFKRSVILTAIFGILVFPSFVTLKAESLEKIFSLINKDVLENGNAYASLGEATSKIGHRLTGSINGKKGEEFAYNLLKSYGYKNLNFQPFTVESWSRDTVSLTLVPAESDNFVDVEVVALAHSPVSSHVSAQIVDCGDGLEGDFEKVKNEIKGKVALFNINIQNPDNKSLKNLHRS